MCVCVCVCGCVCVWVGVSVCVCVLLRISHIIQTTYIKVKCAYSNFTNRTQNFRLSSFVVLKLSLTNGAATKVLLTGSPVQVGEKLSGFMTDVIASRAFGMHGNSFTNPEAEFSRH
jgi:hypothetical protein